MKSYVIYLIVVVLNDCLSKVLHEIANTDYLGYATELNAWNELIQITKLAFYTAIYILNDDSCIAFLLCVCCLFCGLLHLFLLSLLWSVNINTFIDSLVINKKSFVYFDGVSKGHLEQDTCVNCGHYIADSSRISIRDNTIPNTANGITTS